MASTSAGACGFAGLGGMPGHRFGSRAENLTAPAAAPAAAFRGLGASEEETSSDAPAFRSLSASEGAAQPADSEAATTQDDDVDEEATWWRSLM